MENEDIAILKEKIESQEKELSLGELVVNPYLGNDKPLIDDGLYLTSLLVIFTMFVFATMGYLIRKGTEPEKVLRTFGSTLVIFAAVFLIVAGYSEQQISPVIGLLGTVAGYILGKSEK